MMILVLVLVAALVVVVVFCEMKFEMRNRVKG
jgi:hypothetical protein